MTNDPKVFVIVLNYNGEDALNTCLLSVFQSDYSEFEVVVVDNGSQDESFEKARIQFSRAHFIKNPANLGFSKGNNVGIRFALEKFADYVFILNNDTIIEKSTLSSLVKTAQENSFCGIVSPIIFTADNKQIWFAGGSIDWRKMKTSHSTILRSGKPYATEYISGCAMLVKKEVFKKIGLFDERFFLYYEDADFSTRAQKAGFSLLVSPLSHIVHLEQSNSKNSLKTYWLVLSGLIFFYANASFFRKIWIRFYVILRKIKNFYDIIFSKNETARDVRKGYNDFKKVYNS